MGLWAFVCNLQVEVVEEPRFVAVVAAYSCGPEEAGSVVVAVFAARENGTPASTPLFPAEASEWSVVLLRPFLRSALALEPPSY